jgi:hemoglobin/transferrin/lactoferrin receptor protein
VTRWLLLRGNAALTRGRDRTADRPLPMIPPLEGTLGARFMPSRLPWIEAEMVAASRQDDPAMGEIATAGFTVVNLRAGVTLGRTAMTVGVENLLDHAYRRHLDPQALLRPGRNLYVRMIREL